MTKLATYHEISQFLSEVERRAFKQVFFSIKDEHASLDIVQDAMLKLVENYSDKEVGELPMLFQRILQNSINDHYRRNKVRNLWTTLISAFSTDSEEESDLLETLPVEQEHHFKNPQEKLERDQLFESIEEALKSLPARQRQAFLLRYWEEMDVVETAAVMGCSEGSVKTHCSRANHAVAQFLKSRGVKL